MLHKCEDKDSVVNDLKQEMKDHKIAMQHMTKKMKLKKCKTVNGKDKTMSKLNQQMQQLKTTHEQEIENVVKTLGLSLFGIC